MREPDARRAHSSADGWITCALGHRHWGLNGAAGLFVARAGGSPRGIEAVVLQHRAPWSHHGGTWGIPGGAIAWDESAVDGALRESHEEAGIEPESVQVLGTRVVDHGGWSYTTVLAAERAGNRIVPRASDDESLAVEWVARNDIAGLPLLPDFAASLPACLQELTDLLRRDHPDQTPPRNLA